MDTISEQEQMRWHWGIGLMSGTSMDGLDMALCRFRKQPAHWEYELIHSTCIKYEDLWVERLKSAAQLSGLELMRLHSAYGKWCGQQVKEFIGKSADDYTPEFIASHGHTIFHEPDQGLSFQLGHPAMIAAETGLTTIGDFRSLDIALGGEGAPLVPIGDALLFGQYSACLNLGGIANISYKDQLGERSGQDVCPCNLLLNSLANRFGMEYDIDGKLASEGKYSAKLLNDLQEHNILLLQRGSSLDKDQVLQAFIPVIDAAIASEHISIQDVMATVTEFIAGSIMETVLNIKKDGQATVLISGGGALNTYLVQQIVRQLEGRTIQIPAPDIINYKEAIIFAFLGLLRLSGTDNTLASVTGAARNSIGGAVYRF